MTGDELERCRLLIDTGRSRLAADRLRVLVDTAPDLVEAWLELGFALLWLEEDGQAETAARRALALAPDDERAHRILAAALGRQGRTDESVAAARRAVELFPEAALTHYTLGRALAAGPRPDLPTALACAQEAVRLEPASALGHTLAGMALQRLGDRRQARRAFREAARRDPLDATVANNLAATLLARGRLGRASDALRAGLSGDPGHRWLHRNVDALLLRLAQRLAIALLVTKFALLVLVIGGAPVVVRAATFGVLVLAWSALSWWVLRRLPRGSLRAAGGLWGRSACHERTLLGILALATLTSLVLALAPLGVAEQARPVDRPLMWLLLGALVLTRVQRLVRGRDHDW